MEETPEGLMRTKRVRSALETKIPLEAMEDFTEDDLEKLESNGFGNAITLSLASEKTLMEVLPGRRGVVTVIVAFFAKPQEEGTPPAKKPRHEGTEKSEEVMKVSAFWTALCNDTAHRSFKGGTVITLSEDILGDSLLGSKIFVRDCYPALLKEALTIMDSNSRFRHLAILGNPGIGKTFFGFFLLAEIAHNGGVVVYENGQMHCRYLLSSTKIDIGGMFSFSEIIKRESTYYVVDGSKPAVVTAKTILLTSPRREIWYDYSKDNCKLRYMPVWSETEIESCRSLLFPQLSSEVVAERFRISGGIIRYTLTCESDEIVEKTLHSAISSVNLDLLTRCVGNPEAPDAAAHRLVHMTVNERFEPIGYRFASEYVADAVYRQLMGISRQNLITFLATADEITGLAHLRGVLFERYAHELISGGGDFLIRELKEDNSAVGSSTLSLLRREVLVFKTVNEISGDADLYLRPQSKNFESVDSIIKPGILFQMTVAKDHPCRQAGLYNVLKILKNQSTPRLYFVVPMGMFNTYKYQKYADAKGLLLEKSNYKEVRTIQQIVLGISLTS